MTRTDKVTTTDLTEILMVITTDQTKTEMREISTLQRQETIIETLTDMPTTKTEMTETTNHLASMMKTDPELTRTEATETDRLTETKEEKETTLQALKSTHRHH